MNESQGEPGWFEIYRNTARAFLRRRPGSWWRRGLVGLVCSALLAGTWIVWDRAAGSRSSTAPAAVNSAASAAATTSPTATMTSARPTRTAAPRPLTRQEARYLRRATAIEPALAAFGPDPALRLARDLCEQFYRGVPLSVRAARVARAYDLDRAEAIEVVEAACASFCPE